MRRRVPGASVFVVILVTSLLGLTANLATEAISIPSIWRAPLWLVLGFLGLVTVILEMRWTLSRNADFAEGFDLAEAAEQLAVAVRSQWELEQRVNRIHDPFPMPVRWQLARDFYVDHWANVSRIPIGKRAAPPTASDDVGSLWSFFQRIPSGRVVVLGAPGTGKTTLMRQFALDYLRARTAEQPVPVVFDLSLWDPTRTRFGPWLVEQLVLSYPGLRVTGRDGLEVAAGLLESQRLLPILDGFDEMTADLRQLAIRELNFTNVPLVLASRTDEYVAATQASDVMNAAAVLVIEELKISAAVDYLARASRSGQSAQRWVPVFNAIGDGGDDSRTAALRRCLCNPLLLGLIRVLYVDGERNPTELLDMSPHDVEDHLFQAAIPVTFVRSTLSAAEGRTHPAEAAEGWLRFIATHMHRTASRDFVWWELDAAVPRSLMALMASLIVAATSGAIVSALLGIGAGLIVGGLSAAGAFLVGRYLLAVDIGPSALPRIGGLASGSWWLRLSTALAGTLPLAFVAGALGGVNLGLAVGLVLLLTMIGLAQFGWLTFDLSAATPERQLRRQRTFALYEWWTLSVVASIVAGLTAWSFGVRQWVPVAGLEAISVSLLWLMLGTPWGRYFLAHSWLALRGRIPWRLFRFLSTAWRLGLVRRVGPAYQFAHVRLQDALVRRPDAALLLGKERTHRG